MLFHIAVEVQLNVYDTEFPKLDEVHAFVRLQIDKRCSRATKTRERLIELLAAV